MPTHDTMTDHALSAFLHSCEAGRGEPCSVTGMGTVKGRWMVKDEDYPEFLDLIHDYLFVKGLRPNNLVEQRRLDGLSPLLIDLDFKYDPSSAIHRRFNQSNIRAFIRQYVQILEEFYDLSLLKKPLRFFISLRPSPYEERKKEGKSIKDGVHIHCPDLVLPMEHQIIIRLRMLNLDAVKNAFEGTGYINDEKLIYDEAVAKKAGWFLYGESKPDIPAYTVASIYSYNPELSEFDEHEACDYTAREMLEILSVRYKIYDMKMDIREEGLDEWTRLLHLIRPQPKVVGTPIAIDDVESRDKLSSLITALMPSGSTPDEITLAKQLVEKCLSIDRANDYTTWMEVGWCLHAIDDSEEMFTTWMDWSAKSPKFSSNNIGSIRKDWVRGWNYAGRTFTIASLKAWARKDNPIEYKAIMDEDIINYIERQVDLTHNHIAKLMKQMYNDSYRAAVDSKKSEWYEYKDNCWRKLAQGIELRNKMSTDVADMIIAARVKRRRFLLQEGGETGGDKIFKDERFDKLLKIEKSLYTAGFKDSVMKECVGLFYEEEFNNKLNSNPYLIGFTNGVLNLQEERTGIDGNIEYYCNFREGKPDDFITYQAGRWIPKQCDPIPYIPYDSSDPIYSEIDDFMEKVFPRPELRAYMWRKMASCLEGTNREQRYDTWIGIGGNGKSKLVDLMSMALGDYATSLQSTVLTRKRPESGAANPDIMAVRNRRFIYMAEPDDGEPLNTSRMKQFTGEDVVEARGLFEDQSKFQITGKMFMLCNKFPAIHSMDRGTWRRVMAVPFESKFVDPESEEGKDIDPDKHIYPRDNQLDAKLKRWRIAFMSKLVHIYDTEYRVKGIEPIPLIVKQESMNYRALFDSFGKFSQARIRVVPGETTTLKDIWRAYRNWYEQVGSGGGGKKLTQTELQKRLDDEFGVPYDKKTYKRIRVFDSDEDIEEYEKELAEATTES
jgi:P4 family phage/plasmid primase-like protien